MSTVEASRRRVVTAGIVGNVMEWYDFAIYGYFARTIGQLYFPTDDPTSSLLAAYAVFAVGFLMRPIGAILFGHIGDRVGRGPALLWSVVAMAIPTLIMGLLPTYAQIGVWAAVLMVICRMVQGLAVGGEYTSSMIFLVEHAPEAIVVFDGHSGRLRFCKLYSAFAGDTEIASKFVRRLIPGRSRHAGSVPSA